MADNLRQFALIAAVCLGLTSSAPAGAQQAAPPGAPTAISLADAVRLGERESEAVRIARAAVDRARGQKLQARSQLFPQITGSASYQRALQLQFQEIANRTASPTTDTTGSGGASSFTDSPLARVFASPNTFILGIAASQTVYSGGRVSASIAAAEAAQRAADLGARTARAQLVYDVATAYFDAQVADQLLTIADSSSAQTERALRQTQLGRDVGSTAEYDLIRARVQRDNQRPVVIAARTQRDVAYLRLRQLLNLPADRPLTLTTPIDVAPTAMAPDLHAASDVVAVTPDTSAINRSAVRQAAEGVHAQEKQVQITNGQRWPQIALTSNYQRFSYPTGVLEPRLQYYFPNWTVSLGVSMPFFTGGRIEGERVVAEANLAEAQQRYEQARKGAAFDTRVSLAQLEQAEATFTASAGTDEQAARAYSIAEVRFNEGIATQLELTQARVDLERSRANRVQAARDVALARLRMALLRDFPLGTSGIPAASAPPASSASSTTTSRQ